MPRIPRQYEYEGKSLTAQQWCDTPEGKAAGLTYETFLVRWKRFADMRQVMQPVRRLNRRMVEKAPDPPTIVDLEQIKRDVAFITTKEPLRIKMKTSPLGVERWERVEELACELRILEMQIVAKRLELARLLAGGAVTTREDET